MIMNKFRHLFLALLLVMVQLPLRATNIELSWSFNQGDAKALQGTVSEEGLFSYATASLGIALIETPRQLYIGGTQW